MKRQHRTIILYCNIAEHLNLSTSINVTRKADLIPIMETHEDPCFARKEILISKYTICPIISYDEEEEASVKIPNWAIIFLVAHSYFPSAAYHPRIRAYILKSERSHELRLKHISPHHFTVAYTVRDPSNNNKRSFIPKTNKNPSVMRCSLKIITFIGIIRL